MTEVSPLHMPDFMELCQTPLNTPLSATEIHQCNETTDKPNFMSTTQANATDSSQDSDPSFPKELEDMIFESPNISPTPTQLPECLQVPSFQNTEPDTNKNLEPTSADEPTKTKRSLIEEIVSQDELEISQESEDETSFIQIKRRKRSTDETSQRTNK